MSWLNSFILDKLSSKKEQETTGVKQIITLPDYKIELPPRDLIRCLEIINTRSQGRITKKDLRNKMLESGLIHVEEKKNIDQSAYTAMNSIDLITIEKKGRSHVISITTDGENALRFLSNDLTTI